MPQNVSDGDPPTVALCIIHILCTFFILYNIIYHVYIKNVNRLTGQRKPSRDLGRQALQLYQPFSTVYVRMVEGTLRVITSKKKHTPGAHSRFLLPSNANRITEGM